MGVATSDRAGFRTGDHVSWTYASDAAHRRLLTAFVADGLARGEQVVYAAPAGRVTLLAGYLDADGHDVERYLADRRLVLTDHETGTDGADPAAAVAAGYAGLRLAVESPWAAADPAIRTGLPGYELRTDAVPGPLVALDCYDLRDADDPPAETEERHARALAGAPSDLLPLFRLHATEDGCLALRGEVDFSCAAELRALLDASIDDMLVPVLDLSGLEFSDVAAMRVIAASARTLRRLHGQAAIRGASPVFARVWSLLGYDAVAPVRRGP